MSIEALNYARRVKVGNTTAKFVLHRLADRADERFSCNPSIPLIAAECEVSDRTVQRALDLLRYLRLISDREQLRANGSQSSNRYVLHGPWDQYAGTGVPFPEIVEPRQKRQEMWAQAPAEGAFRDGTAAAVALSGDQKAAEEAARRAEEAAAKTAAAAKSKRLRGSKAAAAKGAGDASANASKNVLPGDGGVTQMSPPPVTQMSPPPVTPVSPLESSRSIPTEEPAPAARSAGAVRRTSTSGSGAAGASGCAATEGHGSSSDEVGSKGVPAPRKPKRPAAPRLTPAQRTAVRAVEAALPPMLVDLVEQQTKTRLLPSQNRTAVLAALDSRTPEQIQERIARRWVERGYEAAAHHGELRNPVAVAMWLLGPTPYCPDPSCEDGFLIDTGEECRACTERKAQRRTAVLEGRLAPKGSSKGGPVECIVCERPFAGEAPETGECRDCRFDAETQIAALAARLAAEDADRQRKAAVDALWADPYGLQAQAPAQTAPAPF